MRYQLRTILPMTPTFMLFEVMQILGAARKGWHGHWLAALQANWRDCRKIIAERRSWRAQRLVGKGQVLHGGDLPLHPALLGTRIERIGYRVLRKVGGWNWRLARRLPSHARV